MTDYKPDQLDYERNFRIITQIEPTVEEFATNNGYDFSKRSRDYHILILPDKNLDSLNRQIEVWTEGPEIIVSGTAWIDNSDRKRFHKSKTSQRISAESSIDLEMVVKALHDASDYSRRLEFKDLQFRTTVKDINDYATTSNSSLR